MHHTLDEVGPTLEPGKLWIRGHVPMVIAITGRGARPEHHRAGAGRPVSVVAPHHGVGVLVQDDVRITLVLMVAAGQKNLARTSERSLWQQRHGRPRPSDRHHPASACAEPCSINVKRAQDKPRTIGRFTDRYVDDVMCPNWYPCRIQLVPIDRARRRGIDFMVGIPGNHSHVHVSIGR